MVMPSPFERMLQQASEQAQQDPAAAFSACEQLFNKSLTDLDVRHLSAFAAHLGGSALGRFDDTVAFLQRCLEHPALEADGDTEASIWRAIAVVATAAGKQELAEQAIGNGVRNATERARVAILSAQALVARRRLADCVPHLLEARALLDDVPDDNELRQQTATIAMAIGQLAEKQLSQASDALQAATATTRAAMAGGDWDSLHKCLFHEARALILAGRPAQALNVVQTMMALERKHKAGPEAQFHTAALAAKAQIVRGQFKIATGALKAAKGLAGKIEGEGRDSAEAFLADISAELEAAQAAVA
ncbi:MAG: hypothetical protein PF961_05470 [Planctomycetota bacterium]|jgi:tetratricopeptide (TPR) repeat protein|nr:hypothetical protein [Planctomycetota bacterium]